MPSNQGRDIDSLFDRVEIDDIREVSKVLWLEVSRHPGTASCECPAIEALCRLRELGYEIVKGGVVDVPKPKHDCGMCEGPLRYVETVNGHQQWVCRDCGWTHTSQDCCDQEEN